MSIRYKAVPRSNPQDREAPPRYYAQIMQRQQVSLKKLASRISARSSVTAIDVTAVLQALLEVIPEALLEGDGVDLGDFGTFWLRVQSEGAESAEALGKKHIGRIRPLFRPGKDFHQALLMAKFERVTEE